MINSHCGIGRDMTDFAITLSSLNMFPFCLHNYTQEAILGQGIYFFVYTFSVGFDP